MKNSSASPENMEAGHDDKGRYFYLAIASFFMSLIGTGIAIIYWMFFYCFISTRFPLNARPCVAYSICFIGFISAIIALAGRAHKRRGRGLAKAAIIIGILWIPVFLMMSWGSGRRQNGYRLSNLDNSEKSTTYFMLDMDRSQYSSLQKGTILDYSESLSCRKELLFLKIGEDRHQYVIGLAIPHHKKTMVRRVTLYHGFISLALLKDMTILPEEEFQKMLAAQKGNLNYVRAGTAE